MEQSFTSSDGLPDRPCSGTRSMHPEHIPGTVRNLSLPFEKRWTRRIGNRLTNKFPGSVRFWSQPRLPSMLQPHNSKTAWWRFRSKAAGESYLTPPTLY